METSTNLNRKLKLMNALVVGALAAAGAATAQAQARYVDDSSFRIGRAAEWNLGAADGACRLRIFVDDKARIQMRGDQIIVKTESGQRSYDQGSVCNQPMPFGRVDDFKVAVARGRGSVFDIEQPSRRNNFTGAVTIDDPQNGGETYELVVAWRNADTTRVAPLASSDPYPYFDETRACQDRVRGEFLTRNPEGDAYLEFTTVPVREDMGGNRERVKGEAWARNRAESRPISYECILNERNNRVLSATYEVRARGRYSQVQ